MQQQSADGSLPQAFASLAHLTAHWAHASEHARREKRATSTMEELRAYSDLVGPLVPAIAAYLDEFPVSAPLPPQESRLFQLAQMYMEVAWAVEFVGEPEERGQVPRHRWHIHEIGEPGR
ncbi:MAG TPA: hypothetical protein VG994_10210 [Steroidobacteraceae bacterium]|nr:hypothetical protein [Steroidobacteraceae bacterium]